MMLSDGEDIFLKDGSRVIVSRYRAEDFESLVEMFASLSDEALRWTLPPYNSEKIERWTQDLENKIVLVAKSHGRVVGYCNVHQIFRVRYRGQSDFNIFIHQDYQNKGLGTYMTSTAVQLARKRGLHRIELSIVVDNKRAIRVYEKARFKIEGILKEEYYGEDEKYHITQTDVLPIIDYIRAFYYVQIAIP